MAKKRIYSTGGVGGQDSPFERIMRGDDLNAPGDVIAEAPIPEEPEPGTPLDIDTAMAEAIPPQAEGQDALRAELDATVPATSLEVDERTQFLEELGVQPLLNAMGADPHQVRLMERALEAMYGESFPLLKPEQREDDWVSWAEETWARHSSGVTSRLHLVRRNRLFRKGIQWISAVGFGPWREPPKPRDAARVVDNMIGPALDQRLQLITEQRPGFRTRPSTSDPNDVKKAEAQQFALEYQWDQQGMEDLIRECAYWAGTDGVAFGEVYWDVDSGPWQGLPTGAPDETGMPSQSPAQPLGDCKCRCRRIEQVRVSAEATANIRPWYWVVRDVLPKARALQDYGIGTLGEAEAGRGDSSTEVGLRSVTRLGYVVPEEDEQYRDQDVVDRYTLYCEKGEYLPQGLTIVVVGRKLVFKGPLLLGMVPLFRFTDGSSDPAFYPQPTMDMWIDSQMRVNAIKSKWVENVRFNAGAKLLAKENAIAGETLVGGTMSVIGVKGLGNVTEVVRPLEGFSLADDAKELLAIEKKCFEDLSGWNDTSRGSFSADQSGRAILAIREQLERIFAPPIVAASKAMVEWAKITLAWMKWGYDLPRTVAVVGQGRPDLARELMSEDFDNVTDVWVDPETLMPMPRALRLFLLQDMFANGLMSAQEYRRRLPFGWTRSISTPDEDQEARARRVVEAIRQTGNPQALPLLWQDDESIHQNALERELILPDDTDPTVRMAAQQRWMALAMQASLKMQAIGGMQMQMGGGAAGPEQGAGPHAKGGAGMSPAQQPLLTLGNPSIASAPAQSLTQSDQASAGAAFDKRSER